MSSVNNWGSLFSSSSFGSSGASKSSKSNISTTGSSFFGISFSIFISLFSSIFVFVSSGASSNKSSNDSTFKFWASVFWVSGTYGLYGLYFLHSPLTPASKLLWSSLFYIKSLYILGFSKK